MPTTVNLMRSLPLKLTYWGVVYELRWQTTQHNKCVRVCYISSDNNYLQVKDVIFYVEAERHYATYSMLQIILNFIPMILEDVMYEDINRYNTTVSVMYDNMVRLHKYCTTYQLQNYGYGTLDKQNTIKYY